MTLGVLGLTSSQVNQRDTERRGDAENIARGLERYYNEVKSHPTTGSPSHGKYPDRNVSLNHIVQSNVLPGVDPKSFTFSFNPSTTAFKTIADPTGTTLAEQSAATNSQTDINSIVYEPIHMNSSGNWEVCGTSENCVRFNLYYRTESDNVLQTIRSKHQ